MEFRKISSDAAVAEYIAGRLSELLGARKRVFWLVCGGSAINVASSVATLLQGRDLRNLAVSLTDERYGPVGHPDSNWQQLQVAGFSLPGASLLPVLKGEDRQITTMLFDQMLEDELRRADYSLGLFGIGADGHTAGILPGSAAVTDQNYASSYDAGQFQRITMTPPAISRLDEAFVYAIGESKWPVLDTIEEELPLDQQPAQALKTVPKLIIFNDHRGVAV